ncbi:MAG: hypothetical protein ACYS7M_06215 [Planctomycetota bacterium]|jgi:hypothetical protein
MPAPVNRTSYRLGAVNPETGIQPVEKVITRQDGTLTFEKMAKIVAPNLDAFRKDHPHTPVSGSPVGENMRIALAGMSDAELARLGVSRAPSDEPPAPKLQITPQAASMATENDVPLELLEIGGGTGRDGKYTVSDIERILDE